MSWLALVCAMATVAAAEEPTHWLHRMNQALTMSSYEGTIAHWQDGKVEMLRIIHRVRNGSISERLVSLDGGREFIHTGTTLACYLPDQRTVLVERHPAKESLFHFPQINARTVSFYDIREVARTRFNLHDTHLITVSPRDEYRYGYRLWIDDRTAMPLKTQLCDSHGHILEQIVFTGLTPNAHIPDSAFKPDVSTEGFQWLRSSAVHPSPLRPATLVWSTPRLPPGFELTARTAQVLPGLTVPVDHMVFSDGLASVSVFVEEYSTQPASGQVQVTESAMVGSSSAFSTIINGYKVTAVGEVPPVTVRYIASSVRAGQPPPVTPVDSRH